jgi:hypothetical protein
MLLKRLGTARGNPRPLGKKEGNIWMNNGFVVVG